MRESPMPGESSLFSSAIFVRTVLAVQGSLRRANTARPGLLRAVLGADSNRRKGRL